MATRALRCELRAPKLLGAAVSRRPEGAEISQARVSVARPAAESESGGKIMLQPRMCNLRSYGSDPIAVMKTRRDGGDEASPFFETLSEYIESSKKSQDFEIISGRLAMIVFAATVTTEVVTGNSLFSKVDVQGIEEAVGVCVGAVALATMFAWFSSVRNRVGRMFTVTCSTFIDTLIDQIVDGLFYESELSDWSDDV